MTAKNKLKYETVLYKNSILIDQISGILEELDEKGVLTIDGIETRLSGRSSEITIKTYIIPPAMPDDETSVEYRAQFTGGINP